MKSVTNTLDPLNLVHKGGSVLSNVFTPWKGGSTSSGTDTAAPTVPTPGALPDAVAPVGPLDSTVLAAQDDYSLANMAKKSFSRTIFAGDDGGYGGKRYTGMGLNKNGL